MLAGSHYNRTTVSRIDSSTERVSFYDGARVIADVAWSPSHGVLQTSDFLHRRVPYGNWLAYEPGVLVGLCAVFVLACAVTPLRRVRNLDVLAVLSLLAPIILLAQRYRSASVLAAVPGLVYLIIRLLSVGLRDREPAPSRPLFAVVLAGVGPRQRRNVLTLLLIALLAAFVMVGVGSPQPTDVAYGVMEGATRLVHGILPYGHLPGDVVHGDTYPPLSYVLYVPAALIGPVSSVWDSVDAALAMAVGAACAVALILRRAGSRPGSDPAGDEAGLSAAIAWLASPGLLIAVSTGTTDVMLGALILLAVVAWPRPRAGGAMIAVAGWFKLVPLLLAPLWLAAHRGRGRLQATAAFGALCTAMVGLVLVIGGSSGISAMVHAMSFQFSRGSPQSLWSVLGISGLQPVAQALVLGGVSFSAVRLARARRHPEDLPARRSVGRGPDRDAACCSGLVLHLPGLVHAVARRLASQSAGVQPGPV